MLRFYFSHAVVFAKKWVKLTACLAVITACDPHSEHNQRLSDPNQLNRALYSGYLQLDPHFVKVAADAAPLRDLLVGLYAFDQHGNAVPAIAKEQFSENQQHWLFILDDKATWSNGEPVTAYDFVASWQRLADPAQKSPLSHYLIYMGINNAKDVIQGKSPSSELGVVALNAHTLQINLSKANAQLPQMLAHTALLPTYQGIKPLENSYFISNSAYRLQHKERNTLVLQANHSDTPFQQVVYRLITSKQAPQQFDVTENLLPQYQSKATVFPRLCTYFYEFNFADPLFKNKAVRQAIRSMISSTEISQGFGLPNYSPLPRTMQTSQDRYFSPLSPEQIFHQLGIAPDQRLTFKLTYDKQGYHEIIAQRLASILGRSDLFNVQLQAVNWQDFLAKRHAQDFQLIRGGWCADYADPVLFLTTFHSQSPDNKSGYANEMVDHALSELTKKILSAEQRQYYIEQIVTQLDNDIALLPLFQYQRKMWIDASIQGISPHNASEVIYSKDLYRTTKGK